MITQLLYVSLHNGIMPDLLGFIGRCRTRNELIGLSSILLSTDKCYLHLLEGNRGDVNKLYNRIIVDPRHYDCTIIRYVDVKNREFKDWNAEHVDIKEFDVGNINLLLPEGNNISNTITSVQAVTIIRRIHAHLLVKSSNLA